MLTERGDCREHHLTNCPQRGLGVAVSWNEPTE